MEKGISDTLILGQSYGDGSILGCVLLGCAGRKPFKLGLNSV